MTKNEMTAKAKADAAKVGAYLATAFNDHAGDGKTIERCAIRFAASLPVDDMPFEDEIRAVYALAAHEALRAGLSR